MKYVLTLWLVFISTLKSYPKSYLLLLATALQMTVWQSIYEDKNVLCQYNYFISFGEAVTWYKRSQTGNQLCI